MSPTKTERNAALIADRDAGDTYPVLAARYGISRGNARDIYVKYTQAAAASKEAARIRKMTAAIEDIPIAALPLPERARNGLWNATTYADYDHTVGGVLCLSEAELLNTPNFGKKSLRAWKACLEDLRK